MKKLLVAMLLLIAVTAKAQTFIWENCDKASTSNFFDANAFYNNQGSATAKMDYSDYAADKKEGTGSLKMAYTVGAGDGWGGYIVRVTTKLANNLNLSTGTHLTFWYKVTKPVKMSQGGVTTFQFKIADYDDNNLRDLWVRDMPVDLSDATGTWKQASVDLSKFKDGGDASVEWSLQFGDSDREIQLEKVKHFEFAFVYITGGAATNTPTAEGEILFDAFSITGDKYAPQVWNFDSQASTYGVDDMAWAGDAGKSIAKLTDESTDKIDGTGALKLDYTINCSQDWGGYVNFAKDVVVPAKFEERTGLVMWVKNAVAHKSANPNRLSMRFTILENSTGIDEETWVCKVPVDWSKASDWLRIDLPLKQRPLVKVGTENDFPTDGFAQPWWLEKGDKTFNHDKIKAMRIELSAEGNTGPYGGGVKGEKFSGTILFDAIQQSGFKLVDVTKPSKPKNFLAQKGNYANLISWGDVDNEGTEVYNIYASKTAITSLTAKGVEKVASNILRGVQVYEHLIKSPQTDKDVTLYYAVQAVDKNKNEGEVGTVGPITNKARGIPTIALSTPNFKADGSLTEFAGIKPFQVKISNGTGYLVAGAGDKNNGDADCSIEAAYVTIDKSYLYFGAEVNDDVVIDDNKYYPDNTWNTDCVDLFFSLYNCEETPATVTYQRGKTPDYHLRFNKQKVRNDQGDVQVNELLLPGENYLFKEKFPTGYTIEAKIPLADLANKRDKGAVNLDNIYVKEGYKVRFDLGIFDNDDLVVGRKGRIFWTSTNGDNGWQNATLWGYTWIGNTDVISTDVEDNGVPAVYSLDQNYPNPFNPTTQIKYSIAKAGNVNIRVYDVLGREVASLVNEFQSNGSHSVRFDASSLSSGVYVYTINAGEFAQSKKMLLIK